MATHSSILAWEIPWTEEPGELQSMGSQTVGHDLVTFTSLHLDTTHWPGYSYMLDALLSPAFLAKQC